MGDLLHPDGGLRLGAHHPVAPSGLALSAQEQLRGDNG